MRRAWQARRGTEVAEQAGVSVNRPKPLYFPACPASALLGAAALLLLGACGDDRPPLAPAGQPEQLEGADPARGRLLISRHGCLACHTVPGMPGPATRVGPPLDDVPRRAYLGGILPNTPDNLARWLLDPPAINPLTAMPATGLTPAQARDIAAFLLTRP
ncbi:cytochrome c [Achromobacter sp. K91]|uniref:c-type cytochrome n=1 Tax=Achromobacter sp. K91 TaxID=2292262 RepID=UPI000E65FC99|nr:c-type cytochrome [Achromobacter sp. K91]RIJ05199.1 cytochrome c [Achromobacter sp. K91]